MTFGEMKTEIATRSGDTSTTNKDRAGEFINDIMFRISDSVQYPGLRRSSSIRTVSGQFAYPLQPDVAQVIPPMILPESDANINPIALEKFNRNIQNPTSTGDPTNFVNLGTYGVRKQPGTKLRFVSDGADTQTVTIYGVSEYRNVSEAITMASSTGVLTSNVYTEVDRVVASSAATGIITATGNSSSGNDNLPVVGTVGDTIVATIAATATEATVHDPGSLIRITSSSANDNTTFTVVIKGYGILTSGSTITEDKVYIEEERALNGASEVESASRFTRIDSIAVDTDLNGNLTIKSDPYDAGLSALTTIGIIPIQKRSVEFPMVGLYPIPNTGRVRYNYYQKLTELSLDGDRPLMDESVHRYIKKWAESAFLAWFGSNMGIQETIQNALPSWQSDMRAIRNKLGILTNRTIVMGGDAVSMHTRSRPGAVLDPSVY